MSRKTHLTRLFLAVVFGVCLLIFAGNLRADEVSSNSKPDPNSTPWGDILFMGGVMIAPVAFFVWLFVWSDKNTANSTPPTNVRIVPDVTKNSRKK